MQGKHSLLQQAEWLYALPLLLSHSISLTTLAISQSVSKYSLLLTTNEGCSEWEMVVEGGRASPCNLGLQVSNCLLDSRIKAAFP